MLKLRGGPGQYSIMLNINIFNLFIILKIFNKNDNILIIIKNNNYLK